MIIKQAVLCVLMRVIFLRHGQYDYNLKRVINQDKKIKIGLNETGKKQAFEVSGKLKRKKIELIFCSEFLRARETAEIINKVLGAKIKFDKRVNEFKAGREFEGKTTRFYLDKEAGNKYNFKTKDGESWNELVERLSEFLNSLKKKKYECVLVVSHEWPIMAAREAVFKLSNYEARNSRVGNCELLEFEL